MCLRCLTRPYAWTPGQGKKWPPRVPSNTFGPGRRGAQPCWPALLPPTEGRGPGTAGHGWVAAASVPEIAEKESHLVRRRGGRLTPLRQESWPNEARHRGRVGSLLSDPPGVDMRDAGIGNPRMVTHGLSGVWCWRHCQHNRQHMQYTRGKEKLVKSRGPTLGAFSQTGPWEKSM